MTQDPPPAAPHNNLVPVLIDDEMQKSYLDYAMSVIVGRAIPDARDGLKPVHRRILYAMHEHASGVEPGVQEVRACGGRGARQVPPPRRPVRLRRPRAHGPGLRHAHDAGRRPGQLRLRRRRPRRGHALHRGAPHPPRRRAPVATSRRRPSTSATTSTRASASPLVLPARYPNLLVNGSNGIAVGMATNIPPHNLGEVIDATMHLIDNPDATIEDLMAIVKGPDFPTGGLILGRHGHPPGVRHGPRLGGHARQGQIEPLGKGDREQIVVTEIPYQVNKAKPCSRRWPSSCARRRSTASPTCATRAPARACGWWSSSSATPSGRWCSTASTRTPSSRRASGSSTSPSSGGSRKVLSLYEMLRVFIDHRRDVVTRRTRFELRQAEAQREIVLGLGHGHHRDRPGDPDDPREPDPDTAREALMACRCKGPRGVRAPRGPARGRDRRGRARQPDYRLTERQAKAILDMRLARLTGLEREKLAGEYGELSNTIAWLRRACSATSGC
jgi:DNA gyrase subunit A